MFVSVIDGIGFVGKDFRRGTSEVIYSVVVEVAAEPVDKAVEFVGDPDVHVNGAVPNLTRRDETFKQPCN